MNIDRWIQIALVLATLLAPILGALLVRPPQTLSESTTTKHGRPSAYRLKSWLQSPWTFPPLLIGLSAYSLFSDIRSFDPLTRRAVFDITLDMAGIVWGGVCFFVIHIVRAIGRETDTLFESQRAVTEILRMFVEHLKEQSEEYHTRSLKLLDQIENSAEINRMNTEIIESMNQVMAQVYEEINTVSQRRTLSRTIKNIFGGSD